ncbi:MAG: hypothetical protein V4689_01335 [Verrucomicrobiota bacterium]
MRVENQERFEGFHHRSDTTAHMNRDKEIHITGGTRNSVGTRRNRPHRHERDPGRFRRIQNQYGELTPDSCGLPFLSDIEPVIANPVEPRQPAIDLVPTFVLITGPKPVHRPGKHHPHLPVRKFKDFIKALLHRHFPRP